MAKYLIESDGGQKFVVEAPDDFPPDRVLANARLRFQKELTTEKPWNPTEGMSGTEKFLAGTGKAMTDLARGAGQWLGLVDRKDVEESRKRDAALMQTGAGTAGNIFGNLAIAAPTALIPGANTIAGAGAVGAVMGALQPSTSATETAQNIGMGGAAGMAGPALVRGYQTAKSFIEPFYAGGRTNIVGRAIRDAAGNQVDDAIRNLEATRSGVPGVQYTAGEAAGNPGIAALQRTATQTNPIVMNEAARRQAMNNAARSNVLEDLAGTDGRRAFTADWRDAEATKLYEAARSAGVNPSISSEAAQANIAKFAERVPDELLNRAKELAKVKGIKLDDATSIEGMHWVKMALDDKINSLMRSGDKSAASIYLGLKNDLLKGLDEIQPLYTVARQRYAEMSKPITEMDVVNGIMNNSRSALTGNLRPDAFARNAADRTAKTVTGMPNATLDSTLSPQTRSMIDAVRSDLERQNFAQTAGRGVGSDTVQKLAYSNMLGQAGVPNFVRNFGPSNIIGNVAQRFGQIAYKDANEKIAGELADSLLSPELTAQLLKRASDKSGEAARDALKRLSSAGLLSISLSSPGLLYSE